MQQYIVFARKIPVTVDTGDTEASYTAREHRLCVALQLSIRESIFRGHKTSHSGLESEMPHRCALRRSLHDALQRSRR